MGPRPGFDDQFGCEKPEAAPKDDRETGSQLAWKLGERDSGHRHEPDRENAVAQQPKNVARECPQLDGKISDAMLRHAQMLTLMLGQIVQVETTSPFLRIMTEPIRPATRNRAGEFWPWSHEDLSVRHLLNTITA